MTVMAVALHVLQPKSPSQGAHDHQFGMPGYQFAVSSDGGGKRNGVKGSAGLR